MRKHLFRAIKKYQEPKQNNILHFHFHRFLNDMVSKSLDESKIIRALGDEESIYDNEILRDIFILTLGYMTRINPSTYGSKMNLGLLQKAASIWVKQYPILQSYIWRPFDIKKPNEWKIGPKRYFVYMDEFKLENIEFEEQQEMGSGGIDFKSAIESSLEVPFDNLNGPLWRLKCIKQSDQYLFLYTSHHGMGDGKNAFALFTHYIDILSELLAGTNEEDIKMNVFESKHCMEELVGEYKSKPGYASSIEKNDYDESLNKLSAKIGNQETANKTRMEYLKLSKDELKRLIAKMKQKTNDKAKLTSVLNAVSAVSLRNLYEKYEMNDLDKPGMVQTKVVVNIRDKLAIPNEQLGVYSVIIDAVQDTNILRDEGSFWQHVENYSTHLHKRIKQNEDMEQVLSEKAEDFKRILNEGFDFATHVTSHDFIMSNIGIMSPNKRPDVIECTDYFCVGQLNKPSFAGEFFHIIVTIDQELHWSMNFGQKFFTTEFFREFKESVLEFINKLIA
jgi:hypothetical protein